MSFYWELQGFYLTSDTLPTNLISTNAPNTSYQCHKCNNSFCLFLSVCIPVQNNITNIKKNIVTENKFKIAF